MGYLQLQVNNIWAIKYVKGASMYKRYDQSGSMTLETSIVLPIFIFVFLFIYGLFSIISAQNQVTHSLVQSAKSLSLDPYLTENLNSAAEKGTAFWGGLDDMVLDLVRLDNNPYFSSQTDWYKNENGNKQIAKDRFIGYFAGGNKEEAIRKCEELKIVGGLEGIEFKTSVENENLKITIKYEIQYWFDFWGMGKIPMEQSITTKLWM